MKYLFCPCLGVLCGRVINGFHLAGDGGHVPQYGGQLVYPVGVQGGHVHAANIGPGHFHREHRQHIRTVGGRALDIYAIIAPRLAVAPVWCCRPYCKAYGLGNENSVRGVGFLGKNRPEGEFATAAMTMTRATSSTQPPATADATPVTAAAALTTV